MSLKLDYAVLEEPLKGQDTTLAEPKLGLFGVFDGLGGLPAGDVASQLAAGTVKAVYQNQASAKDAAGLHTQIRAALDSAEANLNQRSRTHADEQGLATTATLLHLATVGGRPLASYAHVGDSRLYMLRDGKLQQLTKDEGRANWLDQALGMLHAIEQIGQLDMRVGDRFMLCSDGITGDWPAELLGEKQLAAALGRTRNPKQAARQLLAISRKQDDKSIVVVDVLGI